VEMLGEIAAADVKGIGRLDRQHGPGPNWGLKWIDSLWKPALREGRTVGPLLLRFDTEPMVRDALLRPVGEVAGRLLYEAGRFARRRRRGSFEEAGEEASSS
jgi:hypothetical protein